MKQETRQRLTELIVEELAEKIRGNRSFRKHLEVFADLPIEKVADAIIKQFDYLLSSDLRELILHMIEQEVAQEKSEETPPVEFSISLPEPIVPESVPEEVEPAAESTDEEPQPLVEQPAVDHLQEMTSIMEHFGSKEPFRSEPINFDVLSNDWLYVYGLSYAPDSSGKGIPTKKLLIDGIDHSSSIFLLDYGDIRVFVSKLKSDGYPRDKNGMPTLPSQKTSYYKLAHERILNTLRSEDVIVSQPPWSIVKGLDELRNTVERRYVDALKALIDMQDALDWDVDVMVFDEHIMQLPSILHAQKERATSRNTRHATGKGVDVRLMERVIFREKSLAQEIHNDLLVHANKNKIDYMVRLDSAIMGDWKSILSARYTVGKDKRRTFCHAIAGLQKKYDEYQLLFSVSVPTRKFNLFS